MQNIITEDRLKVLANMPYDLYLETPEWRSKRLLVIERDRGRCRICNSTKNLHVHHREYSIRGMETLDTLTTLCQSCHNLFHKSSSLAKTSKKESHPNPVSISPKTLPKVQTVVLTETKCHHCGAIGIFKQRTKGNVPACTKCFALYQQKKRQKEYILTQYRLEYMASGNKKKHANNAALKKFAKLHNDADFRLPILFRTST